MALLLTPIADDTDRNSLLSVIDEIDAIGTKRYESQSGGEREIQRTMLELLNQMDGFDSMGDVKVGRQIFACLNFLQLQLTVRAPGHLSGPNAVHHASTCAEACPASSSCLIPLCPAAASDPYECTHADCQQPHAHLQGLSF